MITIDDISVSFGKRSILSHVSTSISSGCITALMGPNGCGKTTLIRTIGGLIQPDLGRVAIDGLSPTEYSPRSLAKKVAIVRQRVQTDFDFTAFETVLMGRNPHISRWQSESQHDIDVARRSMELTSTLHLSQSSVCNLSGGELQRVMIARALAQETPVLLMDEPVSNLDISHQIEIMRLLRETGKTVVIVLHDLGLALHFCSRLLLLHHGDLVYDGPMSDGLTGQRIRTVFGVGAKVEGKRVLFDYDQPTMY